MSPTYIHRLQHPGSPQPPSQDLWLWAPMPCSECGWSSITRAQAAPYELLILVHQANTPRSHIRLLQVWVPSCCTPCCCQSSGWCRLLTQGECSTRSRQKSSSSWGSFWQCQILFRFGWWFGTVPLLTSRSAPLVTNFHVSLTIQPAPFLKTASGVPLSLFNPVNGHSKQTS